jgi:hypothetical protein
LDWVYQAGLMNAKANGQSVAKTGCAFKVAMYEPAVVYSGEVWLIMSHLQLRKMAGLRALLNEPAVVE